MLDHKFISFCHSGFEKQNAPHHYKECGLDNILLLSGFDLEEDEDGEKMVAIHNIEGLHREILRNLALKKSLLTPSEIRFIRREMDMTQAGLGNLIGSSSQCVGRWEKLSDNTPIPSAADLLMKIIIQDHLHGIEPFELLKALSEIDDDATIPQDAREANDNIHWLNMAHAA